MIRQIDKIELADGTILEIKFRDKWFENPEIKKAFRNIVVATKVDETKPVLRFLFIHPSYFRAFEEFGLPLLFMPIVGNYDKYQTRITEVIQSSKERANLEFSEFTKKIAPIIVEAFVKPFFYWLKEAKKQTRELAEEEIKKQEVWRKDDLLALIDRLIEGIQD